MKKVLIINPFGIGDVLFTTPVIANLKNNDPGLFIGYWCNERVLGVLKNNHKIDKIIVLSRGDLKKIFKKSFIQGVVESLRIFQEIKKEKFDLCLDFYLDHRYALVAKFAGIKKRIGFDFKKRGRFLTDKVALSCYADKHMVEHYLGLLKFLDIQPQGHCLELSVDQAFRQAARETLSKKGITAEDCLVAIAPGGGASWGLDARIKHWPAKNFAQLADKLTADYGVKIVLLGDNSERGIAEKIVSLTYSRPVDLVGRTTIDELIALIDIADLLIANDGGPLHIAVALGKKTVSFFGPVDPAVYGPYPTDERRHIVLKKTLECSPCYKNFRLADCLRQRECLEKIGLEETLVAVKKILPLKK